MTDYYVDLSSGLNGSGTAGSPYNTFTGIVLANYDRVWVRRTSTPFTGTLTLTTTGVEIIGWPRPGEYGWDDRNTSLPGWDSDVADYWVMSPTASNASLVLNNAPNTYVSRLNIIFTSVGSAHPIQVGDYCTLNTVLFTNNFASTGPRYIGVNGTGVKILNTKYVQTLGTAFGGYLAPRSSPETPAVWLMGCVNEVHNGATSLIVFGIPTSQLMRGSIFDLYLSGINNATLTQSTITFNIGADLGPAYSVVKLTANSSMASVVHFFGAGSTGVGMNRLMNQHFLKAPHMSLFDSTNYQYTKRSTYNVITDKITGFRPINANVVVYPLTTATEIVPANTTNLALGQHCHTVFNKVTAAYPPTSANVEFGATSFRDGSNIWSSVSRLGESSSSEVFRVGGAAFSVSTEITSTATLGTTGSLGSSSPYAFPLLIGSDAAEVIRVSLIPGLYEIKLYGTDTVFPYNDRRANRAVMLEYCDRFGPTCQIKTVPAPDTSTWSGIGASSRWKYTFTVESDDAIDVFIRMMYFDVYAQDKVSFLDPLPEIINLEI